MKKLFHLIFGHEYRLISHAQVPGTHQSGSHFSYPSGEHGLQINCGFTEFVYWCGCGSHKIFRALGKHEPGTPADAETAALRKMAGL